MEENDIGHEKKLAEEIERDAKTQPPLHLEQRVGKIDGKKYGTDGTLG